MIEMVKQACRFNPLRNEMADFSEVRPLLVDVLTSIERDFQEPEAPVAADALGAYLKNLHLGE